MSLRGYCISERKLAYVLCSILKLSTLFLENNTCILYSKLSKELKDGIEILVGQAVCKLWIKTVKMSFGSITQEPLALPKF